MKLIKNRWYAVSKYKFINDDPYIGRFLGSPDADRYCFYTKKECGLFVWEVKTSEFHQILAETPDPRKLFRLAKWIARGTGLDFI